MRSELMDFVRTRKKANLLIVCLNIVVFLYLSIFIGSTTDAVMMEAHGAMFVPDVLERREYYRLLTSMFLHFGMEHLVFNMLLLIFAGDMLTIQVGTARYLCIYLGGGLAGNLLSLAVNAKAESYAVSAGASGAIFAVIGALVFLVIIHRGRIKGLNGRGICAMAVLSLLQGFTDTGVDNYAHLGGFIGGFLLAAVFQMWSYLRNCRRV